MCVIIIKDKAAELPKRQNLENCFDNNPDGAGFMYTDGGRVVIDKGYMTEKSFFKQYEKLCKKYNNFKNKSLIIHMRITTDGSTSKKNCHPFVISKNFKDCHKLHASSALGVAHNGIINDYKPPKNAEDISDTIKFVNEYLAPILEEAPNLYKNQSFLDGLEIITSSKLAFLDANDNIFTCGNFTAKDGILYSNNSYTKYTYNFNYNNDFYKNYYDGFFDTPENDNIFDTKENDDIFTLKDDYFITFYDDNFELEFFELASLKNEKNSFFVYDWRYNEVIEILEDGSEGRRVDRFRGRIY